MVNNLGETMEMENTLEAPIYASVFPRSLSLNSPSVFYNAEIYVHLQDKEGEQKSRGLKSQPEKKVSFTLEAMTLLKLTHATLQMSSGMVCRSVGFR